MNPEELGEILDRALERDPSGQEMFTAFAETMEKVGFGDKYLVNAVRRIGEMPGDDLKSLLTHLMEDLKLYSAGWVIAKMVGDATNQRVLPSLPVSLGGVAFLIGWLDAEHAPPVDSYLRSNYLQVELTGDEEADEGITAAMAFMNAPHPPDYKEILGASKDADDIIMAGEKLLVSTTALTPIHIEIVPAVRLLIQFLMSTYIYGFESRRNDAYPDVPATEVQSDKSATIG